MSKTPLWLLANQTTFYLQSQPGLGLQFKQELFSRKPAAVTCQRTVTADHPMTGCEYRYGICAVGIGNRTDSFGHTDTQGHFSIRDRLSERYFQQFVPHSLLKVRTNEKKRQIELFTLSGKKLVELPYSFLNYFRCANLEFGTQHPFQPPVYMIAMFFHLPVT